MCNTLPNVSLECGAHIMIKKKRTYSFSQRKRKEVVSEIVLLMNPDWISQLRHSSDDPAQRLAE